MDSKEMIIAATAVGAIGLVAFAAYEFTKPASALTTTTGTAQTYTILPSAVGVTQNCHVGDTVNIQVPTSTQSGYIYAFDQTLSTLTGLTGGTPTSSSSGGVTVTNYPFKATATGSTTLSVSLYASSDGQTVTQLAQQQSGTTLSATIVCS